MSVERLSKTGLLTGQSLYYPINALLIGCAAFLLTLFCLELIAVSGRISPLWFATTLMTIVVFRAPSGQIPLLLLACLGGTMLANGWMGGATPGHIRFALLNLFQALVGGALLRTLLDRHAPLDSLRAWLRFVLSVGVFIPLVSGLVALWLLPVNASNTLSFFFTWVISEMVGMLALGPVLLLFGWPVKRQMVSTRRVAIFLITLTLTSTAIWLALRFMPWPFTVVVIILFWCAVRLPKRDAFVLFWIHACFISLILALGLVTIETRGGSSGHYAPHLAYLMVLMPSHVMALVMDAFQREKKHISESEQRFRHAMEYSGIGVALIAPSGNLLQVNPALCQTLGYTATEMEKLTFTQITHPDDVEMSVQQAEKLLRGETDAYTFEKRYFHKNGQIVWARLTVSLVRDSSQQPLFFIDQIVDISELKQSEMINHRLMERITLANEAGEIGVYEWNIVSNEMMWDRRMYAMFGLPVEQKPSLDLWRQSTHPADRDRLDSALLNTTRDATAFDVEYRILHQDGLRSLRTQAKHFYSAEGRIERILGICQDVTQLRTLTDALFEEKERMTITLESIGEAVISTDSAMRITFMNSVAEEMSGWPQPDAAGKLLSELLPVTRGRHGPRIEHLLFSTLPERKTAPDLDDELVLHAANGREVGIHYSITPLHTGRGNESGAVIVIHDVSESRRVMQRLSYSALHDTLTRLPNRASFERQLALLLNNVSEQHVLVFIDLDKFKRVNDTAGHAAGDALLCELASLMQQQLRATDFLARLGGDEFALLMPDCPIQQASEVVQRIVTAVNGFTFRWREGVYQVGASAGLTQVSRDNCLASELLSQADIACYRAKNAGRGQLAIFT